MRIPSRIRESGHPRIFVIMRHLRHLRHGTLWDHREGIYTHREHPRLSASSGHFALCISPLTSAILGHYGPGTLE